MGVQLGFDISRYIDLNIEVGANSLNDRFNSKHSNSDDWQGYALAGFAIKFAHKKAKAAPAPEPVIIPEVWETRIDTIWYNETLYNEVEFEETHPPHTHRTHHTLPHTHRTQTPPRQHFFLSQE